MRSIQYAPVVIPTLNRYDHFKRCLESLEQCTGAKSTEVYVGLDYPPSEKYVEGWKLLDKYLFEKEKNHGFKKLIVRRRNHNCGAGNPTSNANLLLNELKLFSDRYILSEDDNEFSPCFLDYMNKGLERYKDESRIYAICAYNYPIDMSGYNHEFYYSHEYSAWGCGHWFKKDDEVNSIIRKPGFLLNLYRNLSLKAFFSNKMRLMNSALLIDRGVLGDAFITYYLYSRDKYTLFPSVSCVRNWGHDGSGVNCVNSKKVDIYVNQIISDKQLFDDSEYFSICVDKNILKRFLKFKMKENYFQRCKKVLLFMLIRSYAKLRKF